MESSQFINQTRLSKKQLQLHVQQQNQKYFLDSPHDNYQQSRCQYFTSVTTPPSAHFPPPPEYPNIHHQPQPHQTQQNHCVFEQPSPSHRRPNIKKFQPDPNGIEVCSIDYENQHNNHVGGVDSSVSDVLNQLKNLLFLCSFIHRNELNWLILNNTRVILSSLFGLENVGERVQLVSIHFLCSFWARKYLERFLLWTQASLGDFKWSLWLNWSQILRN